VLLSEERNKRHDLCKLYSFFLGTDCCSLSLFFFPCEFPVITLHSFLRSTESDHAMGFANARLKYLHSSPCSVKELNIVWPTNFFDCSYIILAEMDFHLDSRFGGCGGTSEAPLRGR
jgi:hypothetical protein